MTTPKQTAKKLTKAALARIVRKLNAANQRRDDAELKNARVAYLAGKIMAAGMRGNWGSKKDGKHINYNLKQLEDMAADSAKRLTDKLPIYRS